MAQDVDTQNLTGLRPIAVLIAPIADDRAQRSGLSEPALRTAIELKLRQSGVPVLPADSTAPKGTGGLILILSLFRGGESGLYAYHIDLELQEHVIVVRSGAHTLAPTWRKSLYGMVSEANLGEMRARIGDVTDEFLNRYLTDNPK